MEGLSSGIQFPAGCKEEQNGSEEYNNKKTGKNTTEADAVKLSAQRTNQAHSFVFLVGSSASVERGRYGMK